MPVLSCVTNIILDTIVIIGYTDLEYAFVIYNYNETSK